MQQESRFPQSPSLQISWRGVGSLLVLLGMVSCGLVELPADQPVKPESDSTQKGNLKSTLPRAELIKKRDGEDWPRFLGTSGYGVSGEKTLLTKWPKKGPRILWEKKIGGGYSAPSIRGNRLVLHFREGKNSVVECMRADTGEKIWRYTYPSEDKLNDPYGYNNGPRCSPLLTKNRCYTYGAEGQLRCLDLETGKKIWERDCVKDFNLIDPNTGRVNWFFGMGCTPILEGDRLIVLVGGQPNSGVVAFDANTGKTLWQAVGKNTWDGVETGSGKYKWTGEEQIISYASPIAATFHGQRHVLFFGRQGLVSLNPKDGSTRFKYWFRSKSYESVNAARPLVIGDKIFLTSAYKQGSALLQVNPDGKSYKLLWRNRRNMLAHWSTPIHVNGYIYGFSGRHEREGSFRCVELKTGKVKWATNGFQGNLDDLTQDPMTGEIVDKKTGKPVPWPFLGRASKIQVGNYFVVLGERGGTLTLVKINPEKYEEITRVAYPQIRWPAWTAPVLSRGRLYIRDEDTLLCLDVLGTPSKSSTSKK
ncbi:MAG: PQQ-binding-like beta-propeller repeat protein [Planctomycetaceae bacterium]